MSNKLKDVLYETILEANKAGLEKSEMKAAYDKEILEKQLVKSKMEAAYDNKILEEQLRSERREKASLSGAHNSQIKSIHTEKALRNVIKLEYTNFCCTVH